MPGNPTLERGERPGERRDVKWFAEMNSITLPWFFSQRPWYNGLFHNVSHLAGAERLWGWIFYLDLSPLTVLLRERIMRRQDTETLS